MATVHGAAKSQTRLNNTHTFFSLCSDRKERALFENMFVIHYYKIEHYHKIEK